MVNKAFKFRLDSKNNILIKEDLQKTFKGDTLKVTVKLGIGSNHTVVEPSLVRDGVAYSLDDVYSGLKDNEDEKTKLALRIKEGIVPFYINLSKINYIATLHLSIENDIIVKESLRLYIPMGSDDNNDLICVPVNATLTYEIKADILEKSKEYIKGRLN